MHQHVAARGNPHGLVAIACVRPRPVTVQDERPIADLRMGGPGVDLMLFAGTIKDNISRFRGLLGEDPADRRAAPREPGEGTPLASTSIAVTGTISSASLPSSVALWASWWERAHDGDPRHAACRSRRFRPSRAPPG